MKVTAGKRREMSSQVQSGYRKENVRRKLGNWDGKQKLKKNNRFQTKLEGRKRKRKRQYSKEKTEKKI
jgi:hypothetical protein